MQHDGAERPLAFAQGTTRQQDSAHAQKNAHECKHNGANKRLGKAHMDPGRAYQVQPKTEQFGIGGAGGSAECADRLCDA